MVFFKRVNKRIWGNIKTAGKYKYISGVLGNYRNSNVNPENRDIIRFY